MALGHLRDIVAATDLPVNADFESGFALDTAGVADSVRLAIETGVAGLSMEDSTGDAANPLYELSVAVERIRAARRAIDKAGGDTLLVGRAECFLVGRPDLNEAIVGSRPTLRLAPIASTHLVSTRPIKSRPWLPPSLQSLSIC